MTLKHYDELPALQVEQVKTGCFEAIYEDNVWKMKLNSNDQNRKNVVEFLFLSDYRMPFAKERALQDTFHHRLARLFNPLICKFWGI